MPLFSCWIEFNNSASLNFFHDSFSNKTTKTNIKYIYYLKLPFFVRDVSIDIDGIKCLFFS